MNFKESGAKIKSLLLRLEDGRTALVSVILGIVLLLGGVGGLIVTNIGDHHARAAGIPTSAKILRIECADGDRPSKLVIVFTAEGSQQTRTLDAFTPNLADRELAEGEELAIVYLPDSRNIWIPSDGVGQWLRPAIFGVFFVVVGLILRRDRRRLAAA